MASMTVFLSRSVLTLICLGIPVPSAFGDEDYRWSGLTKYTSTNGYSCATPCEQRGREKYWCYLRESRPSWRDEHGDWGHCSPGNRMTYKGEKCNGSCNKQFLVDVYTCSTGFLSADYCGPTLEEPVSSHVAQFRAANGRYCVSECKQEGKSYNWCWTTEGSWDRCSAFPGYDVEGYQCSSPCDFHGGSYMWCRLKKGGWNYCGTKTMSSQTHYTYLGSKCLTPCVVAEGSLENRCYDATQKPRACSRVEGLSVDDHECTSPCSVSSGRTYYTCDTPAGNRKCGTTWDDYGTSFGHIMGTLITQVILRRTIRERDMFKRDNIELFRLRTNNRQNIFELRDDQGNNQITFFERLARDGNNAQVPLGNNRDMQEWLHACLANWRANMYRISPGRNTQRLAVGGERGNEERRGLRLDQQSRYTLNGGEYVNLQIQVNGASRVGGSSTTVAEVQVPVEVVQDNPNRVVDALMCSAYQRFGVHICRFSYPAPNRARYGD